MTSTTRAPGAGALIDHLKRLADREDRGALAALRRGLGKAPGEAPEMYRHVEWAFNGAPDEAYTVASLFGLHPNHHREESPRTPRGLGGSLRAIRSNDTGEDEGVARRFTALLDADGDALPDHLRHLIALLRSRKPEASVDYLQLCWDLRDWDLQDRHVQKRWAAGFWGAGRDPEPAADATDDDQSAADGDDDQDN